MKLRLLVPPLLLLSLAGCYGEMNDQPRYRYLAPSELFSDGASARVPPGGTVAREQTASTPQGVPDTESSPPPASPSDWRPGGGTSPSTVPGDQSARPDLTEQLLARGKERFQINCMPCHGPLGEGNGAVVQHGFPMPHSFQDARLRKEADAHFFGAITNGYGRMFPYSDRVSVPDRWAIVAYIRALQLSYQVPLTELPPDVAERARKELK